MSEHHEPATPAPEGPTPATPSLGSSHGPTSTTEPETLTASSSTPPREPHELDSGDADRRTDTGEQLVPARGNTSASARALGRVANVIDPEGVEAGRSNKRIAVRYIYGIVAALVALLVSAVVGIWLIEPTVKAEKAVEKELEEAEEKNTSPFVVRATEEDPGDWPKYALSRPLKDEERKKLETFGPTADRHSLTQSRAARKYLKEIGAKPLSNDMVYSLAFFSERKSPLSITNLRAEVLDCVEAKAVTIIDFINQGNSSVSSVYFNLAESAAPARIADEDNRDEPYFKYSKIDLGAGETPGALRVSGRLEELHSKDCQWNIQADYRNSQGEFKATVENANRDPFVALGVSENYQEYWTRVPYDGGYWQVCKPTKECTSRPER
ncbi:hypothetical protein OG321_34895 [Streptomyces sp. NBC_00424]|uniref:hypothetical protein n=1 Tax=Streptomyces sp. NBC_00424 TaxID=2903648 RepID=UPI00224D67DC|nr:hypothetical protein [Streptomyces sp. NBC_00424]MCX5077669.1 hypothetical protein [Streptomyces sp. NBC_00424]